MLTENVIGSSSRPTLQQLSQQVPVIHRIFRFRINFQHRFIGLDRRLEFAHARQCVAQVVQAVNIVLRPEARRTAGIFAAAIIRHGTPARVLEKRGSIPG